MFLCYPENRRQRILQLIHLVQVVIQGCFRYKVILCVWWNFEGVLHFELVPSGRSIDGCSYPNQIYLLNHCLALVTRKCLPCQHDKAKQELKESENKSFIASCVHFGYGTIRLCVIPIYCCFLKWLPV